MPRYDYICKECKKEFSISGSYSTLFSYEPICPDCRSTKVRKLITAKPFILKGKGFYSTDKNTETPY